MSRLDGFGNSTSGAAGSTRCSLPGLAAYVLCLGTFGFGGPIALAGYMRRDLPS